MIYVLLDTNIIIDMVVDRRNNVKDNILSEFIKLLDFDEIKLIVPEIIRTETFRHLNEELIGVGKKIENALDVVKGLYGVSTLKTTPLDVAEYKKNARAELNSALTVFKKNKELYKADIFDTINLLFSHRNTIVIEDLPLMEKVLKRKIYKRAPFHKVEKESNGDGVITESLINIADYVTLHSGDVIYFVTGNYKDFSSSIDSNLLHEDILEDLKEKGLDCCVKYIRSFGQLVRCELIDSLKNANALESLQKELEAEEEENKRLLEEEKKQYEADMVDLDRESVGMSSLDSFEWQVEELLSTGDFAGEMNEAYVGLRSISDRIIDLAAQYEDLIDCVKYMPLVDLLAAIEEMEKVCGEEYERTYSGITEFIDYLKSKLDELTNLLVCDDFENLEFDMMYNIYSPEQEQFRLIIDGLWINPSAGEKDEIDITLSSEEDIWHASIEISYGDVEFDDDGGIGDAYEEYVFLSDRGIVKQIEKLINQWEIFLNDETKLFEKIYAGIEV